MEKGRYTQWRSIISNARVIKAITECGPLLLASVGNSPKLERMDFSPVLSAMTIIALLYNQATAPFFKIITQNLLPFQIAFCCGFPTFLLWVSASTGPTANAENTTMLFKLAELQCIALSNNAEMFFIWSFQGLYSFFGGIYKF